MRTSLAPRISLVDAGNEAPPKFNVTLLGVEGEDFTPSGQAVFAFFAGSTTGRPLAHAVVVADQNGHAEWGGSHGPKLGCGDQVAVIGHDLSSGRATDIAVTTVFCPGDAG